MGEQMKRKGCPGWRSAMPGCMGELESTILSSLCWNGSRDREEVLTIKSCKCGVKGGSEDSVPLRMPLPSGWNSTHPCLCLRCEVRAGWRCHWDLPGLSHNWKRIVKNSLAPESFYGRANIESSFPSILQKLLVI